MTLEEQATTMNKEAIVAMLVASREFSSKEQTYQSEIKKLQDQLSWLKRQMFGKKSERSVPEIPTEQGKLFEVKSASVAQVTVPLI